MRKMFARLSTLAILLVFTMAVNASASPPGDTGTMNTYQVVSADFEQISIDVPTIDADVYTIAQPVVAQVKTLYSEEVVFVAVREVTPCRKISSLKAESGAATENAVIALNSACTNLNSDLESPPLLYLANVVTNNSLIRNLQHTNYGYPLTAD